MELRWLMRYETRHDPHEGRYYVPVTVLQFYVDGRGWQDVPVVNELETPNKAER